MYKKYLTFLISVIVVSQISAASLSFDVKKYGAKGDGVSDDYNAIMNCIRAALKENKSKILIPLGKYKISQPIVLFYLDNDITIEGISNTSDLPEIITTGNFSILSFRGFLYDESKGIARVSNLKLTSANLPYSLTHPKINKPEWNYGLSITDKKEAYIDNVVVNNVYGEGIFIATTQLTNIPLSARFKNVEIKNSKIINVWGFFPKDDSYGDGIYISNVEKGLIENNEIRNDFIFTKQLGRAGLVLEYMTQNCVVRNNYIFGYDRGIHIEADYGGHILNYNKIEGTDFGITIFSPNIRAQNRPIEISDNLISNVKLPKNNRLNKIRGILGVSDRTLLDFTAPDNSRTGSLIKNNQFLIDGEYDYFSNSIINIKAENVTLLDNLYTVKNVNKLTHDINYFIFTKNFTAKGEKLSGVSAINLFNSSIFDKKKFLKNNTTNKAVMR